MAEENNEEVPENGSKSKKKLIITIVLVAVLAAGLSVGVTLFLLMGDDEKEEEIETPEVVVKTPTSYMNINPAFLVTYNVDGRQRYMQVSLSVSSRDTSAFASLEYHMPLIRSKLISTYSGMDFNLIKTEAGKLDLQSQTVSVINTVLESEGKGQIENVYFTNFVLQ